MKKQKLLFLLIILNTITFINFKKNDILLVTVIRIAHRKEVY
jgi:hypothetical protein